MRKTFRCGCVKSEANSIIWLDKSRNQIRSKCRRCHNARSRKRINTPEYRAKQRARYASGRRTVTLTVDDPRHGTVHGYNGGKCRCEFCKEAMATYHRVRRLKIKAKKLGIPIPRELNIVRSVQSLDARFGGDEPRIGGGVWDDPTGDEAIRRAG